MLISIINLFFIPAIVVVIGFGIAKERPYVTFLRYAIATVITLVVGKLLEILASYVAHMDISIDEIKYTIIVSVFAVFLGIIVRIISKYITTELDVRRKDNEK